MRYDACIIGGGAEGLACAAWLAGRGLKTLVIERTAEPGGRCRTREFAPGFFASPYADELAAIPPAIFRALDLARRGALLMGGTRTSGAAEAIREVVIARVMADAAAPAQSGWLRRPPPPAPWPGEELAARPIDAVAPEGTAWCDGRLGGNALAVLCGAPGGLPAGGLGRLGHALRVAAEDAGAEILCGLEATDIRRRGKRAVAVVLADGRQIATRAVISTLDLKRTFLTFFAWNELPKSLIERIGAFRSAPGIARLLLALEAPPSSRDVAALRRPIVPPCDVERALRAWRGGTVPDRPPTALRVVSAVDPFLAPDGAAVMTLTLAAIPYKPFDGGWTNDRRNKLNELALKLVEEAVPGTAAKVKASTLIVPPDIENELGLTEGDLAGGEFSATQMLSFRPFCECAGSRTPVPGLYLAGPSSALGPLATCASGVAAAVAVLADRAAGRLP